MKQEPSKPTGDRVGIFRGTFDPIHMGHISFANQAILSAKLDYVYFLPEKSPKHKNAVEDFSKRLKTIDRTIKQYANLRLLELPSMNGSIERVLPELKSIFGNAKLVFLMGSDVAKTIYQWADVGSLCKGNELIIGMRKGDNAAEIKKMLTSLPTEPVRTVIIDSPMPGITSSSIRDNAAY